jgi:alkylation response protein AidB-like acyl-CoA dehydrogenase
MNQGRDTTMEAAVAKTYVSEASVKTHMDALQIHGGYGYMTEFGIERTLRDVLASTIYSGTSEMQRRNIARRLGL